jgi:hypothetical protein
VGDGCAGTIQSDRKVLSEPLLAYVGKTNGTGSLPWRETTRVKQPVEQSRAQRPAKVRNTMAPIQTGVGEAATPGAGRIDIDTQSPQEFFSR